MEQNIFRNDCRDNGQTADVIENDSIRLNGRLSMPLNDASRIDGLLFRDKLKQSVYDHDLYQPLSQQEWHI